MSVNDNSDGITLLLEEGDNNAHNANSMNEKRKKRDPYFINAGAVMKRATHHAREKAKRVSTGIIVIKNG